MSASETQWIVKPNMGRPPGRISPVAIDHIYRDPDIDLLVYLLVNSDHPDARGRHWSISWQVGELDESSGTDSPRIHRVERVLHIVREVGLEYYTNWGPITRFFETTHFNAIPIATISLLNRKALEEIASSTEVYEPNGAWNCQDWVVEVLRKAIEKGIFTTKEVDMVLAAAR
jgi:hypothetical protein